jgi:hypothetical protein
LLAFSDLVSGWIFYLRLVMDWTYDKDPGLEALACFDGLRPCREFFRLFYDRCQARAEEQGLLDCRPYFTIHWSTSTRMWIYRKLGAEFFETTTSPAPEKLGSSESSEPKKLRQYFYFFQDLLFKDRFHALAVAYYDMFTVSRQVPELVDEEGMDCVLHCLTSEAQGIFDLDLTMFDHMPLPDNAQEIYLGPSALMRAKGYKEFAMNSVSTLKKISLKEKRHAKSERRNLFLELVQRFQIILCKILPHQVF